MIRSLKARLAIWVLLPTALMISIDMAAIYRNAENTATSVQQRLLYGSAKIIAEQLTVDAEDYFISIPPAAFELFKAEHTDQVYFSVRTREGKLIAGGDELPQYKNAIEIDEEKFFLTTVDEEPVRVITLATLLPDSSAGDYAITQVAQTLRGHKEFRDNLIVSAVRGHFLLLSIAIISLAIALRWILEPLMRFSKMLSGRPTDSLDKLEEQSAPVELQPVIHALNDYAEKLTQALSAYEKFVSNTAHHLRTSFAIMTSQIDFAKRSSNLHPDLADTLDSIRKTMTESTKLINQLLILAAIEQNRHDRTGDILVRITEPIMQVIEQMAPLAQQKQIELGVDEFDETLYVRARPNLLHEVFSNLIGNAIQHMGRPGSVTISLYRDGNRSHATLTDDGVGVPATLHERLFDRFFRIDTTRANNSGLGLAIAREICEALGGSITASTPPSGSGLRFDLYFPLPPDL